MSDVVIMLLSLALAGVLASLFGHQWRRMTTSTMTEAEVQGGAQALLVALREVAPAPDRPVAVDAQAWSGLGFEGRDAVALCQRLVARGQVTLPSYSTISVLLGQPPQAIALTSNSWERYGTVPVNFNGPTIIGGGTQFNTGRSSYSWDAVGGELARLRIAVEELVSLEPDRDLAAAAATLARVEAAQSATDPALKKTLEWLRQFGTDSLSGASGSLIASLAFAVMAKLGC